MVDNSTIKMLSGATVVQLQPQMVEGKELVEMFRAELGLIQGGCKCKGQSQPPFIVASHVFGICEPDSEGFLSMTSDLCKVTTM